MHNNIFFALWQPHTYTHTHGLTNARQSLVVTSVPLGHLQLEHAIQHVQDLPLHCGLGQRQHVQQRGYPEIPLVAQAENARPALEQGHQGHLRGLHSDGVAVPCFSCLGPALYRLVAVMEVGDGSEHTLYRGYICMTQGFIWGER